jgi:2',3'-cyclic-nucleotide 2'-phosphodiesterase (5'-nucleotidase family)
MHIRSQSFLGSIRAVRIAPVLVPLVAVIAFAAGQAETPAPSRSGPVTISVVGTTDLHGRVFAVNGRGGLELFGGFMANLRAARDADGGALLLLDTGDAYQGGIESNLSEGAVVVDAYNALRYTAAAIGNHEFEFGAVDTWTTPHAGAADPRGALKARAAQARFPFLAANLIDLATQRPVEWPNVHPSVLVDAGGVSVGIVGVMTLHALSMTLTANVGGLAVAPLAPTIAAEASRLRARGARVVIVAAHEGGSCGNFGNPADLSSCDEWADIFTVARQLPRGLVDLIVAGHTHEAVAHEVAGIPIVQAYSWGRAFSRADLTIDRETGRVTAARIFAPREVCARETRDGRHCAASTAATAPARADTADVHYEGRPVVPDPSVRAAMAPALRRVTELRATPLGVILDSHILRGSGDDESALGNLFADALRELVPDTDAAVSYSAGPGGLRADLEAGPATLGAVYDVFPFDNRVVHLDLTGAQLRALLTSQLRRQRSLGRPLGIAGLQVRVDCGAGDGPITVTRHSGAPIGDGERLRVATIDFMAARMPMPQSDGTAPAALLTPPPTQPAQRDLPLLRDAVMDWLRRQGGHIASDRFANPARARWARTDRGANSCGPA